jgi:pilus assembly protein CpaB
MVLAVLLGLAAAIVGYFGLTSLATQAAARSNSNYRDVVVTATDLTFGQKLDKEMLRVVKYPKESVPTGAYSTMDSVMGQTTKVFMSAREPVTALKLSTRGGGLSMLVRPSMRAASVEVNQVSGVSGFVLPGDRVDVLCTINPRNANDEAETHTVLQNSEVLAAGQKTQQQDNRPITVQAVTLLVDPQGAEILAHAQHEGSIQLVLRNPEDQDTVKVASYTTRELQMGGKPSNKPVAMGRGSRRASAPAGPVATAPATKTPENRKVRIIRSADVSETPAVSDTTAK